MKQIISGLWEIDEIGDGVHCYLWEWEDGITLIDAGFATDAGTILDALTSHGYSLHDVQRIIVTHVDADHTGGLAAIKRATQSPVACHTVEKKFLENPKLRKPAAFYLRSPYWFLTSFVSKYRMRAVVPDELLVDGQTLPEGFTVIHTPGHTPGHISLLHKEKRVLITGDALSNRNNQLRQPIYLYTPDERNAIRSIWKLAKKYGNDYDTVAFGHGPPFLQNGGKRIQALASQIFSRKI